MNRRLVIFSHGKESGPWGTKISALAPVARKQGFAVESIDYTDLADPDARVGRLVERCAGGTGTLVLVGSSMGGYVATVASQTVKPAGLFLMAPAVYLPGYAESDPTPSGKTYVVHGMHDEVIPMENAVRFAQRNHARLFLVDGDHALVGQLPFIEELFGLFLASIAAAC
ncbi:alpha/beta hydrolase [Geobacter hydrogenophilus]|uniref:Alpha/beta hydrolase n=1 Tax=Geobacter hydrogenophilus TaxID=40983 RepID=A0A9W6LEJ0_9BACT|nr:YqiA/YcfP family alpha/beta fold hydrolase [Geobacter hydrogenophilus]MBT0892697.1 alpha/beta hydrolase [Geobacter hydrogenophilus]GLI40095.1 alpha/beta hydrolase [Geobacter hydrogenophilus]